MRNFDREQEDARAVHGKAVQRGRMLLKNQQHCPTGKNDRGCLNKLGTAQPSRAAGRQGCRDVGKQGCRDVGMQGCGDASPDFMVPPPTTSLCPCRPFPQPQGAEVSSAQLSSVQLSSAQLSSAQLSSAQLSSAPLPPLCSAPLLWPRWGTWQNEGRELPSRAEPSS